MGDQLQRFQKRAFEIDDLGEIELVVPPGFGGSALEEFAEGETGDWTALKRQKVNDILDSIPENQDPLTHLQEKEQALLKEIDEAETERERRIAELEDELRRSILHRFPDASERERDRLFRWVRDGRESLHRMSMDLLESGQITDPESTITPPRLWKKTEEKERWRNRTEQFRRVKAAVKPLKFRVGMVQIVKRFARVGALDELRNATLPVLPDIFNEGTKPLEYATEIVRKYQRDPGSLPDGRDAMGRFKEGWVPDSPNVEGNSKVSQIFRVMRKEPSLSDEYSDPESFCDLLERLLERHRKD